MTSPLTVHLRVNDSATGQPTPTRLRIVGPNGEFFAPLGRSSDFPLGRNEAVGGHLYSGGKKYVYIDGSCEIRLPAGLSLEIEISKGPEYEPIRESVTLGPGQMALRYAIRRWIDLRAEGWLSADTRCHFLTPHDALLEAAAEDVAFVHLLATEHHTPSSDGHLYRTIPNMSAFSGQKPALEAGGHAVIVNTFNTHPVLGRLGLLNSHRPVFPLSFGGEDSDDWSLSDWCNQCHRKGGLTVWCDAFRPESGLLGGEALVDLILGQIDVLEFDSGERSQPFLPWWYRLLNAGIRAPLVGGSGKDSNRVALGSMRTYTLVSSENHGLGEWVVQARRGHSFVSNGPMLNLNKKEYRPEVGTVTVEATARAIVPFDRLEIIVNGETVADASPTGPPCTARIECELSLPEGGWFAVRCLGSAKAFAHTSPVWVTAEGKPAWRSATAVRSLRQPVEQTRAWVENHGRFANEKRKMTLLGLCDRALRRLDERAVTNGKDG